MERRPVVNLLLRMLIKEHGIEPFDEIIETLEVKALRKERYLEDCAAAAQAICRAELRRRVREVADDS